jgi:hypothetical protein
VAATGRGASDEERDEETARSTARSAIEHDAAEGGPPGPMNGLEGMNRLKERFEAVDRFGTTRSA